MGETDEIVEELGGSSSVVPFDDETERKLNPAIGPAETVEEILEGDDDENSDSEYCDTDLDVEYITEDEDAEEFRRATEYKKACDQRRAVPVTQLVTSVLNDTGGNCTVLDLSSHGLGYDGAVSLAKALEFNDVLTELLLTGNSIGNQGGAAIATVLKKNSAVLTLDLSRNEMSRGCARALSLMLSTNSTITTLNLSENLFDDSVGTILADAIAVNLSIAKLNMSHNQFGDPAGAAMGAAFESNTLLHELDLSWNNFRGEGGAALAGGCIKSSSLRKLNLTQNGLGNAGAVAIAAELKENRVLLELRLSRCRIQRDGSIALAQALENEPSLQLLDLSGNPIGDPSPEVDEGDAGILVWLETCAKNHTLGTLDMRRVSNRATTSAKVFNFIQRSSVLHNAIITREEVERALTHAQAHADTLAGKQTVIGELQEALKAKLAAQDSTDLGALVGRIGVCKDQLAKLAGPKVWDAWRELQRVPATVLEVLKDDGALINAARDACRQAIAANPADSERPVMAAYEAYVAAPGGSSADVGEVKYQAGYSALSGVCAFGAAEQAFAKGLAEGGEEAAAAAANTAFATGFGHPYTLARENFSMLLSKHPNTQQPALEGARELFAELGGNEAFDPILEIAEAEAITQAARTFIEQYPAQEPARDAGEGALELFEDQVNEALELAIKCHKEYFGRTESAKLKQVLRLHVAEVRFTAALEAEMKDSAAALTRRRKKHDEMVAAEQQARDEDHASGTRPDLHFRLDFGVKTSELTFASFDWLTAFENALESLDMGHFEWFDAVDSWKEGFITLPQIKFWLAKNPIEMTERQTAAFIERLVGDGGADDAAEEAPAKEGAGTPVKFEHLARLSYHDFMERLYLVGEDNAAAGSG